MAQRYRGENDCFERRILKETLPRIRVSVTGKIAIVTLIHPSDEEESSADELAKQIRGIIESQLASKSWTIEQVTVLDG